MINLKSVPRRSESIVTRKTGNEYVLVPVTDNIADMNSVYTLNDSAAFIWELIDGKKNVEELIEAVTGRYDIDRETAVGDVFSLMRKMSDYLVING
jgi:methyltransferase-like protein